MGSKTLRVLQSRCTSCVKFDIVKRESTLSCVNYLRYRSFFLSNDFADKRESRLKIEVIDNACGFILRAEDTRIIFEGKVDD